MAIFSVGLEWSKRFIGQFSRLGSPDGIESKARAVQKIFKSLDRSICSFQRKAGYACPTRCGQCCAHSNVETTVVEMLPLAFDLINRGQAELWWERAQGQGFSGRCVFYQADSGNENNGRCTIYVWRPLICRLFGFAGNRDKHGKVRLVACGIMKKVSPQEMETAMDAVNEKKLKPVVMSDEIMKIVALDPELGKESLPINLALKQALDRVWIYRRHHG